MTLMLARNGGALLSVSGMLAGSSDCCCEETVPINSCVEFRTCISGADIEVTIADVPAGACCEDYNGVFILTGGFPSPSEICTNGWSGVNTNACAGVSFTISCQIQYNFFNVASSYINVFLYVVSTVVLMEYRIVGREAIERLCANLPVTLNRLSSSGCSWPATITVQKV